LSHGREAPALPFGNAGGLGTIAPRIVGIETAQRPAPP